MRARRVWANYQIWPPRSLNVPRAEPAEPLDPDDPEQETEVQRDIRSRYEKVGHEDVPTQRGKMPKGARNSRQSGANRRKKKARSGAGGGARSTAAPQRSAPPRSQAPYKTDVWGGQLRAAAAAAKRRAAEEARGDTEATLKEDRRASPEGAEVEEGEVPELDSTLPNVVAE